MKPVLTSAVAVALLVMTARPSGGQPPKDKDPTKVLPNVAAQTGLTVKLEKRTIKVLVVKKDP